MKEHVIKTDERSDLSKIILETKMSKHLPFLHLQQINRTF